MHSEMVLMIRWVKTSKQNDPILPYTSPLFKNIVSFDSWVSILEQIKKKIWFDRYSLNNWSPLKRRPKIKMENYGRLEVSDLVCNQIMKNKIKQQLKKPYVFECSLNSRSGKFSTNANIGKHKEWTDKKSLINLVAECLHLHSHTHKYQNISTGILSK